MPEGDYTEYWKWLDQKPTLASKPCAVMETRDGGQAHILYSISPDGAAVPLVAVQPKSKRGKCYVMPRQTVNPDGKNDGTLILFDTDGAQVSFVLTNFVNKPGHIKIDLLSRNQPRDVKEYEPSEGLGINAVNEIRPLESFESAGDQNQDDRAILIFAANKVDAETGKVLEGTSVTVEEMQSGRVKAHDVREFFITVTPPLGSDHHHQLFAPPNRLVWIISEKAFFDPSARQMPVARPVSAPVWGQHAGQMTTRGMIYPESSPMRQMQDRLNNMQELALQSLRSGDGGWRSQPGTSLGGATRSGGGFGGAAAGGFGSKGVGGSFGASPSPSPSPSFGGGGFGAPFGSKGAGGATPKCMPSFGSSRSIDQESATFSFGGGGGFGSKSAAGGAFGSKGASFGGLDTSSHGANRGFSSCVASPAPPFKESMQMLESSSDRSPSEALAMGSFVATVKHGDVVGTEVGVTDQEYQHELRTPGYRMSPAIMPAFRWFEHQVPVSTHFGYFGGATTGAEEKRRKEEVQAAADFLETQLVAAIHEGGRAVFESDECVICMESGNDALLLRCMHKCMHLTCVEECQRDAHERWRQLKCPLCRAQVNGWLPYAAAQSVVA